MNIWVEKECGIPSLHYPCHTINVQFYFRCHNPRGTQTNEGIYRKRETMIGDLEPDVKEWMKKLRTHCMQN